jgi:hypothetical protein
MIRRFNTVAALIAVGALAAGIFFAVYLALDSKVGRAQTQTLTKSIQVDRGTYYRLKVNLAYKGAPLTFDIVVGCKVRVTTYKDNDRTVEVGVAPMAYGLKMPDGRGIVVRPPEACGGETTANGKVPATLLPLIVTYEKADEPWFGLAYASDEAFESPIAELKFFSATIDKASRQEWDDWRRTEAPKNFVTYDLLGVNPSNRFENVRWKPGKRFMGSQCLGLARVKLADAAREIVRAQWPANKPTYWYPNDEARKALRARPDAEAGRPEWLFEGYRASQHQPASANFFPGLRRREPGALIFFREYVAGTMFPSRTDLTPNLLDPDGHLPQEMAGKSLLSWSETELRPELRGFAYCDNVQNIDGLPSAISGTLNLYRFVNRINGEVIQEYPPRNAGKNGRTNFALALERDEYVYFYRNYGLSNIFGGL